MTMAELRCEQISASYGAEDVLSGVDLVVPDGTLTAILGASGSGKTTLLRVIMGFVAQQHGTVAIGGTVVARAGDTHLPPEKRSVGYVAQEGALYPHLTVAENVLFGLPRRLRKAPGRASEVLELVGLSARYGARRPHELSGGEQRRVALARALAPRPPLVLLDEPFSGLDAGLREDTRAAVLHALAAQGTTAVLVTHDQAEALSMGREVGVLMAGRLIQTAAPTVLYRTPASLEVAQFVGKAVVLRGRAGAGVVSCPLGELPLVERGIEGIVEAMIRPEQIQIHRASARIAASRADDPAVTAMVSARTFQGPDSVVQLRLDGTQAPITARILGHDVPEPGERVELAVVGEVMAYLSPASQPGHAASPKPGALVVGPARR
jgi:iron(III) transport system ATP-binding protein